MPKLFGLLLPNFFTKPQEPFTFTINAIVIIDSPSTLDRYLQVTILAKVNSHYFHR